MEFKPRKFRIQAYDSFTRSQSISTNRRVSSIHCVEKYAKLCSLPDFDNFLRFSQDELESNLNQVGDFFGKILKHCGVQAAATRKGGLHLPASQQVRWVMSYFLMQRRHLGIFQVQINRPKLELLSSVKKTWRTSYHKEILQHFQHEKIGKLPRKPLSAICHVMSRL